jgi:hypothetical protein
MNIKPALSATIEKLSKTLPPSYLELYGPYKHLDIIHNFDTAFSPSYSALLHVVSKKLLMMFRAIFHLDYLWISHCYYGDDISKLLSPSSPWHLWILEYYFRNNISRLLSLISP